MAKFLVAYDILNTIYDLIMPSHGDFSKIYPTFRDTVRIIVNENKNAEFRMKNENYRRQKAKDLI